MKQRWFAISLILFGAVAVGVAFPAQAAALTDQEQLGKLLFFDPNLSVNRTQSCATCHAPEVGFTGPDSAVNTQWGIYPGALEDRFGNRKPPAASYAGESPVLYYDEAGAEWVGGMFWDGRATGAALGDPLAEQAGGPYLNPLEQAMPNARLLCLRVREGNYAGLFETVWGAGSLDCIKDVNATYERIMRSVAAYERSAEVNPFSSKFDAFWDQAQAAGKDVTKIRLVAREGGNGAAAAATIENGSVTRITVTSGGSGYLLPPTVSFMGGGMMATPPTAVAVVENGAVVRIDLLSGGSGYTRMAPRVIITGVDPYVWDSYRGLGFTDAELKGLAAFNDPNVAGCADCHTLEPGESGYPLFTDFRYDNIGMPKNPNNPFYTVDEKWNPDGADWVDEGLGGYLKSAGYPPEVYEPQLGKFKVPTLRNVDRRPTPETVKAFGHNGAFTSLDDLVHFYAWRGMLAEGMCGGMGGGMGCMNMFPPPEVDQNVATMKHFNMMDRMNIVTFLKTLSDGYPSE